MFHTINYRGHYIHETHLPNDHRVTWQHAKTFKVYRVKSYRAAQLAIAKAIRNS